MRSVSYVQVNNVPPSSLFHHVALVRTEFTTFCSQIRSQHSKRTTLGATRRCVREPRLCGRESSARHRPSPRCPLASDSPRMSRCWMDMSPSSVVVKPVALRIAQPRRSRPRCDSTAPARQRIDSGHHDCSVEVGALSAVSLTLSECRDCFNQALRGQADHAATIAAVLNSVVRHDFLY